MLVESRCSPEPGLRHPSRPTGPQPICIGDLVVYRGSVSSQHGLTVYRGLCECARRCARDTSARVQLLCSDGTVIRHVHCRSFARGRGEPEARLRAAADRLRAERILIEATLAHRMSEGAQRVDPSLVAWHPIAAQRGSGTCRGSEAEPPCPRCASAARVRTGIGL